MKYLIMTLILSGIVFAEEPIVTKKIVKLNKEESAQIIKVDMDGAICFYSIIGYSNSDFDNKWLTTKRETLTVFNEVLFSCVHKEWVHPMFTKEQPNQ